MDDFDDELVQAFRTPTDRPGRWEIAAAVEQRLRRRVEARRIALTAASLLGVGIAAAGMALAGALGPLDDTMWVIEQARTLVERPMALTLLGLALLVAALGGVAAREL